MTKPFMEHPSGRFSTAVAAMADAIRRLRSLREWDHWITFCAQGMGHRLDSYHMAEIRMRESDLEILPPRRQPPSPLPPRLDIDVEEVTRQAGVPPLCLSKNGDHYSLANATPEEAARVLDAIFRHGMGIRPHSDSRRDDYAIAAEWIDGDS